MEIDKDHALRHEIGNILQPLTMTAECMERLLSRGDAEAGLEVLRKHVIPIIRKANSALKGENAP